MYSDFAVLVSYFSLVLVNDFSGLIKYAGKIKNLIFVNLLLNLIHLYVKLLLFFHYKMYILTQIFCFLS